MVSLVTLPVQKRQDLWLKVEGSNAESVDGSQGNGSINTSAPSGESYRIQIGFYDKRDLSHLINNGLVMRYENVDGTMRYSLGDFSSPEEGIHSNHPSDAF